VTLLLNQSELMSHTGYSYRHGVYGGEYGHDVSKPA
jgi:hypothetical protein